MHRISRLAALAPISLPLALLAGCSISPTFKVAETTAAAAAQSSPLQGNVHGGQQPVSGAHVYLFAAGTGGTGTAATSLLSAASTGHSDAVGAYVLTDANGVFILTNNYTCTAGQQVYIYSLGGNPGSGTNTAAGFLAALGACPAAGNFAATYPLVQVSEVSTVAAAYAMAGYATSATQVASSGSALALTGIANAFANAASLDNLTAAQGALSVTPGGNGTVPQAKINAIANLLAACINSVGSASPACTTLFANATNGTTLPTDTATAAINIAHNPGTNVGNLFGVASGTGPFQPSLSTAPNDFSITLTFSYAAANSPTGIAIDASGNAIIANFGGTNATKISPRGVAANNYSFGHLLQPYGVAIDTAGNYWLSATGGPYVYEITSAGSGTYTGPFPVANRTRPALDGANNWYVPANSGATSQIDYFYGGGAYYVDVSSLITSAYATAVDTNNIFWTTSYSPTATGSANLLEAVTTSTGISQAICTGANYTAGSGIAIDHSNNVWISDYVTGYLVEFSNGCAYTASYNGGGLAGTHPVGIAMDGSSRAWALTSGNQIVGITNAGAPVSGATGYATGQTGTPAGPVVDGSGNIWFTNSTGNTVSEMIGAATPVVTPIAAGVAGNTLGMTP